MVTEKCVKTPGVYGLIGKMVQIRHATEADMGFIIDALIRNGMDARNLDYGEFVVATEDGEIVGFARIKKAGMFHQIGCIVVVEEKRGKGLGSLLIRHLLEVTPMTVAYVPGELRDYFSKLGFAEMQESSKELLDSLDNACNVKGRQDMILMVNEGVRSREIS